MKKGITKSLFKITNAVISLCLGEQGLRRKGNGMDLNADFDYNPHILTIQTYHKVLRISRPLKIVPKMNLVYYHSKVIGSVGVPSEELTSWIQHLKARSCNWRVLG